MQYSEDLKTMETVESPWLIPAKEGKDFHQLWRLWRRFAGKQIIAKKGQIINRQYYASLLTHLRKNIKSRRKLTKGVFCHQTNVHVHKSAIGIADIHDCGFHFIYNPPDSPDLARSDFYLFQNWKHYQSDDDVIHAVDDFLKSQEKESLKVALGP